MLTSEDLRTRPGTGRDPPVAAPRPRTTYFAERRRPLVFRWPAPPYLLAADVATFLLCRLLFEPLSWIDVVALTLLLGCFHARGLYKSRLSLSVLDDVPAISAGVLLCAVASDWLDALVNDHDMSLGTRIARAALLLAGVVGARALGYGTIKAARRSGRVRHKTIIIGAGHVGQHLAETLKTHRGYGLDPIGFVDSHPRFETEPPPAAPLLGGYQQLPTLIRTSEAHVAIVAFGGMSDADLIDLLRLCDRLKCDLLFVPRFFELLAITRDIDQVRGLPLVRPRRAPFRAPSWRFKRIVDGALAGIALVILSPLLVACAALVRLESGPGFLFRQERIGLDGRLFTLLKFRSLRPATEEESSVTWNISDDARLGPVGKLLRRTSLDELPQLWNVLVGDMSLVGPRPERPYFADTFASQIPRYTARHRVPVGLSGWAQVHGLRGDTSIEDRANFDNHYIENWSLWGDSKIILRTVGHLLHPTRG